MHNYFIYLLKKNNKKNDTKQLNQVRTDNVKCGTADETQMS